MIPINNPIPVENVKKEQIDVQGNGIIITANGHRYFISSGQMLQCFNDIMAENQKQFHQAEKDMEKYSKIFNNFKEGEMDNERKHSSQGYGF